MTQTFYNIYFPIVKNRGNMWKYADRRIVCVCVCMCAHTHVHVYAYMCVEK